MNYAELYATRAQRAVDTGVVDLKAFIDEMMGAGAPVERIHELLNQDLNSGGPIFGKFFRSLELAGESVLSIAEAQGSAVVESLTIGGDGLEELKQLAGADRAQLEELARNGDPDAMEIIERSADDMEMTWICTLRKTCELCLPLHGKSLSKREWRERGLIPRAIHINCECDWMPTMWARDREDLNAPLVRNIEAGQEKGGKRTIRGVTSSDVDRAVEAVNKAKQSEEGMRVLKLLGESRGK